MQRRSSFEFHIKWFHCAVAGPCIVWRILLHLIFSLSLHIPYPLCLLFYAADKLCTYFMSRMQTTRVTVYTLLFDLISKYQNSLTIGLRLRFFERFVAWRCKRFVALCLQKSSILEMWWRHMNWHIIQFYWAIFQCNAFIVKVLN